MYAITRLCHFYRERDLGSSAGLGGDLQLPAQGFGPAAQVAQAVAPLPSGRIKADAVVRHAKGEVFFGVD